LTLTAAIDLARRKHFTMLLTNKIGRALRARSHRDQTFRVWVDPIASRYDRADEAVHVIANNVLRKRAAATLRTDLETKTQGPIVGVHEHDSRDTPQIQLCDLLLGAVMDAWQENAKEPGKLAVKAHIAGRLEWPDRVVLQSDRESPRDHNEACTVAIVHNAKPHYRSCIPWRTAVRWCDRVRGHALPPKDESRASWLLRCGPRL
jgi:hypothetical protein